VSKYLAAVWLTVAVWTPVAFADEITDVESARANARAGGSVSGSAAEFLEHYGCESGTRSPHCQKAMQPKQKARPQNYETDRASKTKMEARARARAAAAAKANVSVPQAAKPSGTQINAEKATGAVAAPKEDLQQTTVLTKSPSAPELDAPAAATCHKYSPAVAGMVEGPC
jgi:hypothetical protein